MEQTIVPIDILPAIIDDSSVVQHRRVNLVGFTPTQGADIVACQIATMNEECWRIASGMAARNILTTRRGKDEIAIRQIVRIKVLNHHRVIIIAPCLLPGIGGRAGHLPNAGPIHLSLINEETPFLEILFCMVAKAENYALAVIRQIRMLRTSRGQRVARQPAFTGLILLPRFEDEQSWSSLVVAAQILIDVVIISRHIANIHQQVTELERGMRQQNSAPQARKLRTKRIHGRLALFPF